MHLYARRKLVEQRLRRDLSSSFEIINAPDHPLLIRGPDLLVGADGVLIALISPTESERLRPERLYRRTLIIKAAFPPELQIVLLDEGQLDSELFDAVTPVSELRLLAPLIKKLGGRREKRDHAGRASIERRFGATYLLSRMLFRRETPPMARRVSRSARRDLVDQVGSVEFSSFNTDPSPSDVSRLILDRPEKFFQPDNGAIYPTGMAPDAVFVDGFPRALGDPEKYLRAAAFAGWLVAPAKSQTEIKRIAFLLNKHAR